MLAGITARIAPAGDYDPLDALPAAARAKVERLEDLTHARHAGLMRHVEAKNEAQREFFKAQQQLARIEDSHRRDTPESREILEGQRQRVARLKAKRDRAADAHDAAEAEYRAVSRVAFVMTEYAEKVLMGQPVKAAPAVEVKLAKGETTMDAIERVRGEIAGYNAEVKRIERAPYPSAEVMARLTAAVDALADVGRPDIKPTLHNMDLPRWPEAPVHTYRGFRAEDGSMAPDAQGMLCWLFRDQMIAALQREVEAVAKDDAAVPAADRPRLLAELAAKRLLAERIEEALVERAEAEGQTVARREEADIRALLGLVDDAPMARK